ncbi:RagB/SusD family nutrient uptake outer membrane protein [Flammeovirga aprica]|uniref:RagB/SusD family nutrient uptake outer membrane protein n=1 Tax=Flammeovirga aprica JL-4 TaxID=694437 RepID=A0A7X9RYM6_9BACT|nr:RagB/SusD family nutrient uptake outer membrane protein [Flammeovirga aprica]NME71123.1 RagB/SusD family nutrient uptake outer membrane protein [Flammeovirga aprica JL-4]
MKSIYKLIIIGLLGIGFGCSNEILPVLTEDEVYGTIESQKSAVLGMYGTMLDFKGYASQQHDVTMNSGFFYSGKKDYNFTIASLNATPTDIPVNDAWLNYYKTINSANDIIYNIEKRNGGDMMAEGVPSTSRNYVGQAYFARALNYYRIFQYWGGAPLRILPVSMEEVYKGRATKAEMLDLIISDLEKATEMMAGDDQEFGFPKKYAANFLLAKVYSSIAYAAESNDEWLKVEGYTDQGSSIYWDLAYEEGLKVHQKYSLVPRYGDLWELQTGNNTTESIFEIQFSVTSATQTSFYRTFTPKSYTMGVNNFGRLYANPELYDKMVEESPEDPRIGETFMNRYVGYKKNDDGSIGHNGWETLHYPEKKVQGVVTRTNLATGFTPLHKLMQRDRTATTVTADKNWVIFRYADYLLMMGAIANKKGLAGDAVSYVNEVLSRARNSGETVTEFPKDWAPMGQDEFDLKVFWQRRLELVGEGTDWFDARKRGYNFFKTNVIDRHNDFVQGPLGVPSIDVTYPDNTRVMYLPIPNDEINSNYLITGADQNPGY